MKLFLVLSVIALAAVSFHNFFTSFSFHQLNRFDNVLKSLSFKSFRLVCFSRFSTPKRSSSWMYYCKYSKAHIFFCLFVWHWCNSFIQFLAIEISTKDRRWESRLGQMARWGHSSIQNFLGKCWEMQKTRWSWTRVSFYHQFFSLFFFCYFMSEIFFIIIYSHRWLCTFVSELALIRWRNKLLPITAACSRNYLRNCAPNLIMASSHACNKRDQPTW